MDREITNEKAIKLYLHCGRCLKENQRPQMLEVGWTEPGLQVWCKRHDINVLHVDFEGAVHKANTTALSD